MLANFLCYLKISFLTTDFIREHVNRISYITDSFTICDKTNEGAKGENEE